MHFVQFGCIWDCLVALLGAKWAELVQKSCHEVASELFATNATDPAPSDPKLLFLCISYYLGAFGPFGCLIKLGAKRAELVQKFVTRSRDGIFCNEHTQSTPLDAKLMFWCVSYYLGAFGTVWLPYETRWKMGRTNANIRAMKSHQNFSQRTHPIHSIGP